ncbi:MAG: hypothetical protein VKQ33_06125 [Candidatus Sericytochromatia bacterium]|nr:hypothetical protein [Candidatus Sericytochromatia bacterium]
MTAFTDPTEAVAPSADWNWRAELAALEAKMAHVASRSAWDWRQALADIEADLERIASHLATNARATS